jgi:hypothetical protein
MKLYFFRGCAAWYYASKLILLSMSAYIFSFHMNQSLTEWHICIVAHKTSLCLQFMTEMRETAYLLENLTPRWWLLLHHFVLNLHDLVVLTWTNYLVCLGLDSSGLIRHTRHNLKLTHLLSFHLTSFTLEFGTPTKGVWMSQTWIGRTWVLQNWLTMTVAIFAGVWWSLTN